MLAGPRTGSHANNSDSGQGTGTGTRSDQSNCNCSVLARSNKISPFNKKVKSYINIYSLMNYELREPVIILIPSILYNKDFPYLTKKFNIKILNCTVDTYF